MNKVHSFFFFNEQNIHHSVIMKIIPYSDATLGSLSVSITMTARVKNKKRCLWICFCCRYVIMQKFNWSNPRSSFLF